MSKSSAGWDDGPAVTRAAGRVAWRMARRHPLVNAAASVAGGFFRQLGRTLYALWLEIAGVFFTLFAVIGAGACWREYRAGEFGSFRFLLSVCFTVLFAWFAASSFWRARRRR